VDLAHGPRDQIDRPDEVREVMRRYAAVDERVYTAIATEYGWRLAA